MTDHHELDDPRAAGDPASALAGAIAGAGDTIVALSTPPGRGAIAVVRLSGARAREIAARVLEPWPPEPRVATLSVARHPDDGSVVDRPVVTLHEAPRSYTGEHVVEIATHGGLAAPAAMLEALVAAGARPAAPGEFTRRAVLNGKMDLLQAEAVADLIDARGDAARRAALAQLDGGLSRRVQALRDRILDLEALIAYDIDFPEEDDGPVPRERIARALADAVAAVDALLATAPAGALVREGAVVVIAGAPNAGKSSLFNALLGQRRAIVTDVPGTTRDAIEAPVEHAGWPMRLVDTAGLREGAEAIERMGIEVSERYLAEAHLVLACADRDEELPALLHGLGALTDAPLIPVRTKADVDPPAHATTETATVGSVDGATPDDARTPVRVSAIDRSGLTELLDRATTRLAECYGAPPADFPLVTRARHVHALELARSELAAFAEAWEDAGLPAPVAAVHLRAAAGALDELIGAVDVEDVLERVFSTFCVGK